MDEIAKYNKERWDELSGVNVVFSSPFLDLDARKAKDVVDPQGVMGSVQGKNVLCLAASGGQQSPAFGLLGANVTVLDLSETQLERDREAAAHYGLAIRTVQGDMRDLSCFGEGEYDVVWQAYGVNFIPDAVRVMREVARVLRPRGLYRLDCHTSFYAGLAEGDWDGKGYPLNRPYVDGEGIQYGDPYWDVSQRDGSSRRILGPREFRHTLGTIVNGLAGEGFVILGLWEDVGDDPDAEPGSWDHFTTVAPPWFTVWTVYRPGFLDGIRPGEQAGGTR